MLSKEQRYIFLKKMKIRANKWRQDNPEKVKTLNKRHIIHQKEKAEEMKLLIKRDYSLQIMDTELEIRLKRCYISCIFKEDSCRPLNCLGCGKNIQGKRSDKDIEAVRR